MRERPEPAWVPSVLVAKRFLRVYWAVGWPQQHVDMRGLKWLAFSWGERWRMPDPYPGMRVYGLSLGPYFAGFVRWDGQ